MNTILIAAYGSLRKEQYNYRADMTYLGTERTPGYALA
jgi:gamma-glutamylcyclotransferase (GGCT)/AIG2-like uncharacterized protein YtfP